MPANSKVVIHWSREFKWQKNAGMGYVSLGRSEQLKDIYIKGKVDPLGIQANPDALEETKRLENIFDQRIQSLNEKKENFWRISYLNVRALKGKIMDVSKDNSLMDADVFALGETWLEPGESVSFDGYEGHFANHGKGKGVAAFSKMKSTKLNSVTSDTFSVITLRTEKFDTIFLYISSGCSKIEVFKYLEKCIDKERPTAIMGDTNMDFLKECKLNEFLENKGFQQLVQCATRESGSLIDHVYANEALRSLNITTEQCSAYYSDHDVITISVPK